eukprot:scaffold2544_cov401-Prasinococcus_capsulatus_cf.AAC.1
MGLSTRKAKHGQSMVASANKSIEQTYLRTLQSSAASFPGPFSWGLRSSACPASSLRALVPAVACVGSWCESSRVSWTLALRTSSRYLLCTVSVAAVRMAGRKRPLQKLFLEAAVAHVLSMAAICLSASMLKSCEAMLDTGSVGPAVGALAGFSLSDAPASSTGACVVGPAAGGVAAPDPARMAVASAVSNGFMVSEMHRKLVLPQRCSRERTLALGSLRTGVWLLFTLRASRLHIFAQAPVHPSAARRHGASTHPSRLAVTGATDGGRCSTRAGRRRSGPAPTYAHAPPLRSAPTPPAKSMQ